MSAFGYQLPIATIRLSITGIFPTPTFYSQIDGTITRRKVGYGYFRIKTLGDQWQVRILGRYRLGFFQTNYIIRTHIGIVYDIEIIQNSLGKE